MTIKYCIFDIGNVCYPFNLQTANECLIELTTNKEAFIKKDGAYTFDFDPFLKGQVDITQFSKDLCAHCYIPYSQGIEQTFSDIDHKCLGSFIPETKILMNKLRAKGYQICLLSNITPDLEDITIGITDKDKTFLSYELGLIKPDPLIYKTVLQKLNAKPEETIFIDDLPANIKAANALKINGIVYNRETIIQDVETLLTKLA